MVVATASCSTVVIPSELSEGVYAKVDSEDIEVCVVDWEELIRRLKYPRIYSVVDPLRFSAFSV